jgi:hypothetical protein
MTIPPLLSPRLPPPDEILSGAGFYELLEGVAQICERECGLLPANVSPDCAIQLTYVAQVCT